MAPIARVGTTIRLDPDPDAGFWLSCPLAERVAHVRELQGCYYGPNRDRGARMQLGGNCMISCRLCVGHGVRFLVVGGYAVTAHGHPRLTKDFHVCVWVDPGNVARMAAVLEEFGFGSLGLSAEGLAVEGKVVQPGYPPNRIDRQPRRTSLRTKRPARTPPRTHERMGAISGLLAVPSREVIDTCLCSVRLWKAL